MPLLVCALAVPVVFFVCNPLIEMGVNDDWGYAHMSKVLTESGHLRYDGWTQAMSVPQVLWGAALIRVFGFSFSVLRESMLPLAMGCSALMYLLARRAGTSAGGAVLVSVSLTLCPIYLPVETSFMTDVPALFLFLLMFYCMLRGVEAIGWRAALWLGPAVLLGIAAGAQRQIYWGAPLLMLATIAYLRRHDRVQLRLTVGLGAVLVAGVIASLAWFNAQPLVRQETARIPVSGENAAMVIRSATFGLLTVAACCLPVLVRLLGARGEAKSIRLRMVVAAGIGAVCLFFVPAMVRAPWLGNLVTKFGVLKAGEVILGERPVVIPTRVSYLLGTFVVCTTVFSLLTIAAFCRDRVAGLLQKDNGRLVLFLWMTVPFCTAFLGIVAVRSTVGLLTDRYLLPLIAMGLIGLIAIGERVAPGRAIVASWIAVGVLGGYGIAATHDAYREWAAREEATSRLNRAGVSRRCIVGGYEYDGWTELETSGVLFPPLQMPRRPMKVDFGFSPSTPSVTPRYYVLMSAQKELEASPIPDVAYSTWLAPRQRRVVVQEDPDEFCATALPRAKP